jgi:hypothetical protein
MTDTLYKYTYIIKEYMDLPLNNAGSGKVYDEMGLQIDRIILSREYLTYDWVMPMHPYMKDYNPFYDAMTYINIIKDVDPNYTVYDSISWTPVGVTVGLILYILFIHGR